MKHPNPQHFINSLLLPFENVSLVCQAFWRYSIQPHAQEDFLKMLASRHGEELQLFMQDNPLLFIGEPQETKYVQQVACQIHKGVIPGLLELAEVFPANPEDTQSRQLLNRFSYFLNQAGELGEMRSEQLRLAMGLRSRKNKLCQLQSLIQRCESHTNKSRELNQHIYYVNQLIQETENMLIPLLAEDPSRGESILLNAQNQAYPVWLQKLFRWTQNLRLTMQTTLEAKYATA